MAIIKDSGKTREFGTGAHRDAAEGKGRCDLIPLDVMSKLLTSTTLYKLHEFMEEGNVDKLYSAISSFTQELGVDIETALLEVAKHYEDGANKYGANNWKKGIHLHVFIDSSIRHYTKWHRKDTDEPHDKAVIWNIIGAIWTYTNLPEMIDIESCKNKDLKLTETITEDEIDEFLLAVDDIE